MKICLASCNCRYTHSCLALFYVRQEITRHLPAAEVRLHQFTINDPYYETLLALGSEAAHAWLFSVYVWNSDLTRRLAADLQRARPGARIVFGGPQAAVAARGLEGVSVVRGEVEGLGPDFYHDLADGALRPEYTARIPARFDSPYSQEDFGGQLKNRNIYYESTRGCPFACAYCLSAGSRGVRSKDLDTVRRELSLILAARPRSLRFVDRTFNADPLRTLELWRFLAAHGEGTCFHFEIAPDRFTPEMFAFLRTVPAGRFQFEVGIQSTNPVVLTAINRRMDVGTALANVARLAAMDTIHIHADLILGLPDEDEESFARSVNDVFAAGPHYIQMGLLKVLPDTPLAAQARKWGLTACARPPYEILATNQLDHQTLARLYQLGECVEAFYNKRWFRAFFAHIRATGNGFAFFSRLRRHCLEGEFFTRAPTQPLLHSILEAMTHELTDGALLRELLVFDWLRCGHRHLPGGDTAPLRRLRDELWQTMPAACEHYGHKGRNRFFKRTVFHRFSASALTCLGFGRGDRDGVVAFLPEPAPGIIPGGRTLLLEGTG